MKRLLTGLMVLGLCAGLCGVSSLLYAADPEPVESIDAQAEQEEEAAWDAWRTDFEARLAADEKYLAAEEEALKGYFGDVDEYRVLEEARAERYREIALITYEEHFGVWTGTTDEFDALMEVKAADENPLKQCSEAATDSCGEHRVCSVKVAQNVCSWTCQDAKGNCPSLAGVE